MSKGTKIIPFRCPGGLEEDMEIAIDDRNERTREAPWSRTDFILKAIREKLDHMQRSRAKKRKGKA
jgi:hypothetical protein